jgi:2-phosphosulfolactate phosphatase
MSEALCEWGLGGIVALRGRVAALVVVDVLSFSTAVEVAVSRGAAIIPGAPCDPREAAEKATAANAIPASGREARDGRPSLSPASLRSLAPGTRLLLPSPNGARLSLAGGVIPVFAGCLRNAGAVARAARALAGDGAVGVIPAGERWPDGSPRFAIEDFIGAGAILEALGLAPSPEARVARDAFRAVRMELAPLIRDSVWGRELIARGFAEDVELAVALEVSSTVPLLRDGAYQAIG